MTRLRWIVLGLLAAGLGCLGLFGKVQAAPPLPPARLLGTAVVYPPPVRSLRFSHAKHPPGDFECTTCHTRAKTSTRGTDKLRPAKKVCVDCHDEAAKPKGLGRPGVKVDRQACGKCHLRFDARGVPQVTTWPKARIRFSHKLHAGDKRIACATCHGNVAKAGFGAGRHLPRMKQCLSCHDGRPRSPPSRCTTCHQRTAGGRMRTHYPDGVLKPGPSLPGIEHTITFRRNHKVAARTNSAQCKSCHQRASCLRCHGGVRRPASIHLGNYILRHGREARANRKRCNACHTRQRFCLSCHQRTGVARSNAHSPYRTPGIRRFHGPNWASSSTKGSAFNRHAVHARRNVGACVSCHRERDCMRCHARRRNGGLGHSPHGPGFRNSRRCKMLLRRNQRACLKCHGWRDPLMALCR